MNRVERMVEIIHRLKGDLIELERKYQGKRKGDIYYLSYRSLVSKIKREKLNLENLGYSVLHKYEVTYRKGSIENLKDTLLFEQNVTTEEIITLYELRYNEKDNRGRQVISIKLLDIIETGIPRN